MGNVLEALYGDQAEEIAVQLARHFLEAGVDEKALRYLLLAGDRAQGGYAHAEAADLYARAARIAQQLRDVGALRRIHEGLGDVYSVAGDNERAVENYRRALEMHTDPRTRADLYNRIGVVYHMNAYDVERGLAAYEQGLQALGEGAETVEAARIHANLGYLYLFLPDFDLAREHLERSQTLLEGARHSSDLAWTYACLAFYYNIRPNPDPEAAIEYANRCLALVEQLDDDTPVTWAHRGLSVAYGYWLGQWEQALPYFQDWLRICTRQGHMMGLGWSNQHLARAYLALGQLDAADRHAQQAVRAWERLGHPETYFGLCLQMIVRERRGQPDEAEALFERATAVSGVRPGDPYYITACIYAIMGDPGQALA